MLKFKPITSITYFLFFFVPCEIIAHSFILSLEGANGVRSTGFGTRLTLRGGLHQNTGILMDKEINDKGRNIGPCGRIFGGDNMQPFIIDPQKELALSEVSGIPTAHPDGTITMGIFVHNPDGAGPFHCEASPDGSLTYFQPMSITKQIEGVDGVNDAAKDYVYQLTAAFFGNTTCTGGADTDTCIIRCRNPVGFGGCAAVKLGTDFIPTDNMIPLKKKKKLALIRRSI